MDRIESPKKEVAVWFKGLVQWLRKSGEEFTQEGAELMLLMFTTWLSEYISFFPYSIT